MKQLRLLEVEGHETEGAKRGFETGGSDPNATKKRKRSHGSQDSFEYQLQNIQNQQTGPPDQRELNAALALASCAAPTSHA